MRARRHAIGVLSAPCCPPPTTIPPIPISYCVTSACFFLGSRPQAAQQSGSALVFFDAAHACAYVCPTHAHYVVALHGKQLLEGAQFAMGARCQRLARQIAGLRRAMEGRAHVTAHPREKKKTLQDHKGSVGLLNPHFSQVTKGGGSPCGDLPSNNQPRELCVGVHLLLGMFSLTPRRGHPLQPHAFVGVSYYSETL